MTIWELQMYCNDTSRSFGFWVSLLYLCFFFCFLLLAQLWNSIVKVTQNNNQPGRIKLDLSGNQDILHICSLYIHSSDN